MMSVKNNNIILFKKFDKLCEKADLVFNFFGEKESRFSVSTKNNYFTHILSKNYSVYTL